MMIYFENLANRNYRKCSLLHAILLAIDVIKAEDFLLLE
jgi:hypothetical protein